VAAIVQQGELDAIIRYQPKQLKQLLNSLIGIDRLDVAYVKMGEALEAFRQKIRSECMNFDDGDIDALREEIQSTTEVLEESDLGAREATAGLSKLELERDQIAKDLEAMEPLRAKSAESRDRRGDLIRYVEKTSSELRVKERERAKVIEKAKICLPVLDSKLQIESQSASLEDEEAKTRAAFTELTSDLRSAKTAGQQAKEIDNEIRDCLANVEGLKKKIQKRGAEITRLKAIEIPTDRSAEQLKRGVDQARKAMDTVKDSLSRINQALDNYKLIQAEGVCPTCGSTFEEINLDSKLSARHKEHTEAKERLKASSLDLESAERLLEKRKEYDKSQESLTEEVERLREYTGELKAEEKKLRRRRRELKMKLAESRREPTLSKRLVSVESKLKRTTEEKRVFREKQSDLMRAEAWLSENKIATAADIGELEHALSDLQARLQAIPKDLARAEVKDLVIDEYASQLVAKVISLESEASKFDETAYSDSKRRLETVLRPSITRLSGEAGGWKQKGKEAGDHLSKLNQAREGLEVATPYVRLFQKIRGEVYNRDGTLATSLRSWALKELSKSASDYIRSFGIGVSEIQLKEEKHDVNIECYSASGMADVKGMSGGEGVAIALALRFAMARLMGKGMVDFIALDEPTTHLDEERKRSLVRLVTEFNSDEKRASLNQIIVITHDREIFEDSEVNAVFQFQKIGDITNVTKS
jgi:exonuclease SbcC